MVSRTPADGGLWAVNSDALRATLVAMSAGSTVPRPAVGLIATIGVVLGLTVAGCSGSDANVGTSATAPDVIVTTTEPSVFCKAISDLDQFRDNPTSDDAARAEQIAAIYESLLDDVPVTLRPDFEFVIATLRSQPPPTTQPPTSDDGGSATFDGEGYLSGSTPAERVGAYIAFACTGSENNPGPAPTDPP